MTERACPQTAGQAHKRLLTSGMQIRNVYGLLETEDGP